MEKTPVTISLPVRFEKPPEKEIPLMALLFTRSGKLLQQQPVTDEQVEFKNQEYDPRELRVFILPASDQRSQQKPTLATLESLKPYEAILTEERGKGFSILPIPASVSKWWPRCSCRVTGKISKWFNINNSWQNRPICDARVHICDIDAIWYWIYKIPDHVIARIPDLVLTPIRVPHLPSPDPGPIRDLAQGIRQPAEPGPFQTTSIMLQQQESAEQLPVLSEEITQTLRSGNLNLIRETVAGNFQLFHPYFCLYPAWWPFFYRCDELAVAFTDMNGRFDKQVSFWCTGDHPDIYLWVECLIGGLWTTVYKPPIPCHTYWNYACGTEIPIQITDSRVLWGCNELIPGEILWVKTIGTGTSVSHIGQQHQMQPPPGQSVAYDRIGLTDAGAIYDPGFLPIQVGDYKRPFGGNLSFVIQFGGGLRAAGIHHYRWSYQKVATASLVPVSDTPHPITNTVYKEYSFIFQDALNDWHWDTNSVRLGPATVGSSDYLYIVPPQYPDQAPFNVPEQDPAWDQNTYSISIDSSGLDDGLYEFSLELFDEAGNLLSNVDRSIFQVPDFNSFAPSVNAPDELLRNPSAASATAFKMRLRIDNNPCQADIYTLTVNGVESASDCCGFVGYKPGNTEGSLGLSFLAAQENNFAVFRFSVQRGTCSDPAMSNVANATGMVIDSANGYIRDGASHYDKSFAPAALLGTCYNGGTGKGAFAEVLSVAAMATDGTYRLKALDDSSVAAFALEP